MNLSDLQKVFQTVAKNFRCPQCGKRYSFDKIHIISSAKQICLLSLECSSHMPVVASVAVSKMSEGEVGEITADEVIEGYKKLSRVKEISDLF